MPASTEPRSGLKHGWANGESGWGADMSANLLRIGRYGFHPSAKSRSLSTPPASPAAGDTYIVGASPTGAWASLAGQIVIWDGAAWVGSGAPRKGWVCAIEDEPGIPALIHDGASWRALPGRPLADHLATVQSGGTAETDLFSATLPINAFASVGAGIALDYGLQLLGALTATRRIRIYLGATAIYDSGAMAATAVGAAVLAGRIIRDGANSARYQIGAQIAGSAGAAASVGTLTGLNFGATMAIKITGQSGGTGSATGDITAMLGKVSAVPAA